MKLHAALLVGLVLLGGCLGGAGGVVFGDGDQGETATQSATTQPATSQEATATESVATARAEATTSSATADCGRTTEDETGATVDEPRETETEMETGTEIETETKTEMETAAETETTLPATTDPDENVTATFVVEDCEDVAVTLMVADEPDERQRGLMYRQSLPNRTGMVFVYDDAAPRTFWMKNTYVPLDIVFVAPDGTVLNVEHAQAQPHAPNSEVDRYSSEGDAKYVVELERGFANRTGVGPGSELVFNGSAPEAGPGTVSATG